MKKTFKILMISILFLGVGGLFAEPHDWYSDLTESNYWCYWLKPARPKIVSYHKMKHFEGVMQTCRDNCKNLGQCGRDEHCQHFKRGLQREDDEGDFTIAVMEKDGNAIGFVVYSTLKEYVSLLAVASQYYSQGYGAQLLSYVEEKIKKDGGSQVNLCIVRGNDKAAKFYKKQGYQGQSSSFAKKL